MIRLLRNTLLSLLALAIALGLLLYNVAWQPRPREKVAPVCTADAPMPAPGQALKVMTWNIQYLAGKRYVFWYDEAHGDDERPTPEDLAYNLDEVARVIRDEQPDVLLLQELDDDAKASGYQDQLGALQQRLADLYPCSAQAFDWKSDFVPAWHILGSVGRKLATLSRYRIDNAERLQLPQPSGEWFSTSWQPKRALLSVYLPVGEAGTQLAVLNTHLDHFVAGRDTQLLQLQSIESRLDRLEGAGTAWVIGGDFNLLPLGQYLRLKPGQRQYYPADSDLHRLWDKYAMIPTNAEASGADRDDWLTHYPNDPSLQGPDRTLDYFFYSARLIKLEAQVRQGDTLAISDHLPVVARFTLPHK